MDNITSKDYPMWLDYLKAESDQTFEQYKKAVLKKQNCKQNNQNRVRNRLHKTEFIIEGYTTPFKTELRQDACVWNNQIRRWIAPNELIFNKFMTKIDVAYQEKYSTLASAATSTSTSLKRTSRNNPADT